MLLYAYLESGVVEGPVGQRHEELRAAPPGEQLEGEVVELDGRAAALQEGLDDDRRVDGSVRYASADRAGEQGWIGGEGGLVNGRWGRQTDRQTGKTRDREREMER